MKATMGMCQTLMLVADDDLLSDLEHIIESKMPTGRGAKQMKIQIIQSYYVKLTDEGEVGVYEDEACKWCILKAPTLEQAAKETGEYVMEDSSDEYEVDVVNVHPVDDKSITEAGVKS